MVESRGSARVVLPVHDFTSVEGYIGDFRYTSLFLAHGKDSRPAIQIDSGEVAVAIFRQNPLQDTCLIPPEKEIHNLHYRTIGIECKPTAKEPLL